MSVHGGAPGRIRTCVAGFKAQNSWPLKYGGYIGVGEGSWTPILSLARGTLVRWSYAHMTEGGIEPPPRFCHQCRPFSPGESMVQSSVSRSLVSSLYDNSKYPPFSNASIFSSNVGCWHIFILNLLYFLILNDFEWRSKEWIEHPSTESRSVILPLYDLDHELS